MAVSLPSDLIVDVMRSADPGLAGMAARRLSRIGAENGGPSEFAQIMDRIRPIATAYSDPVAAVLSAAEPGKSAKAEARLVSWADTREIADGVNSQHSGAAPYVAFEQMFLRNMLEAVIPQADSGLYGDDASAGVWRSMAVDQLAAVYAKSGGIGLADQLASHENRADVRHDSQWPYFETNQIRSFSG